MISSNVGDWLYNQQIYTFIVPIPGIKAMLYS